MIAPVVRGALTTGAVHQTSLVTRAQYAAQPNGPTPLPNVWASRATAPVSQKQTESLIRGDLCCQQTIH